MTLGSVLGIFSCLYIGVWGPKTLYKEKNIKDMKRRVLSEFLEKYRDMKWVLLLGIQTLQR